MLALSDEAQGVDAHQGHELLGGQVVLGQTLDYKGSTVGLGLVLNGVTLVGDVLSALSEEHRRTSAVLNSSVATELNEISNGELVGDVVAFFGNVLHFFDGEQQFFALGNGLLVLQGQGSSWTSNHMVSR